MAKFLSPSSRKPVSPTLAEKHFWWWLFVPPFCATRLQVSGPTVCLFGLNHRNGPKHRPFLVKAASVDSHHFHVWKGKRKISDHDARIPQRSRIEVFFPRRCHRWWALSALWRIWHSRWGSSAREVVSESIRMPLGGRQTVNLHVRISLFCMKKKFLSKCKTSADTKQYTSTTCGNLYVHIMYKCVS